MTTVKNVKVMKAKVHVPVVKMDLSFVMVSVYLMNGKLPLITMVSAQLYATPQKYVSRSRISNSTRFEFFSYKGTPERSLPLRYGF